MIKKLGKIVDVSLGHTFRTALIPEMSGDCNVLQAKNIDIDGGLNYDFVKIDSKKSYIGCEIMHGDVLLTNRGDFRASVYDGYEKNVVASSSVYVLRGNGTELDMKFLAIYLNSSKSQKFFQRFATGATIKNLPKPILESMDILIPNIAKQKAIVKMKKNKIETERLYKKKIRLQSEIVDTAINELLK